MELPSASIERVIASVSQAGLGDPRRHRRLIQTVASLAQRSNVTFPESMGSNAAMQGGYRLVNNPHVRLDTLLEAQAHNTAELATNAQLLVAIHDTTTCKFEHVDPQELGYLNTGKAGFMFHYTLVVDFEQHRRPLGVIHGEVLCRSTPPRKRHKKGRSTRSAPKKQNREFQRWQRGIDKSAKRLDGCNVVHVADRESDSYELMANNVIYDRRFVFRARVTQRRGIDGDGEAETIQTLVRKPQSILTRQVPLSKRQTNSDLNTAHPTRQSRTAQLSISATQITIKRPRNGPKHLSPHLEINVVRVYENSPPTGVEPVEWILYTTEPVQTEEQLALVVDLYRTRWLIEECNKALKTGCLYEQRQFESRAALLALLGMSLPIACEILWLRTQARQAPDQPATNVLSNVQINVLRAVGSRKLPPQPSAQDILLAVAALAGHQLSNGDPGWQILQRGMSKLLMFEQGWRAAAVSRSNL